MVAFEPPPRAHPALPTALWLEPPSLAYSRQTLPAQRLFAVLSALPGTDHEVTALATAMVAREAEVLVSLRALIIVGLVEQRADGRFAPAPAAARFRPPRIEARAVHRWYDWCLSNVTAGADALYPQALRLDPPSPRSTIAPAAPPTSQQAAAWFDAEIDNLAAATIHAHRHGLHRYAWLLADALRGWSWQATTGVDWTAVASAARNAARLAGDGRASAAAHLCVADAAIIDGDLDRAIEACTVAERKAARAGWLSGRAAALGNRGGIHRRQGRFPDALRDYDAALELFGAAGRVGHKGAVFNHIGAIYLCMGAANRAVDFHRRALAIHRQVGSIAGEARSLHLLAEAFRAAGQREAAERGLVTALAAYGHVGDRAGESLIRSALTELRADIDVAA